MSVSDNKISKKDARALIINAGETNRRLAPVLADRRKRQDLAQSEIEKIENKISILEKRCQMLENFRKNELQYQKEQEEFAKRFGGEVKESSSRNIDAELDEIKSELAKEKNKSEMYKKMARQMKSEADKADSQLDNLEKFFRNDPEFKAWFDSYKQSKYQEQATKYGEKAIQNKAKITSMDKLKEKLDSDNVFKEKYENVLATKRDENKALKLLVSSDPECAKVYSNIEKIRARKTQNGGEFSLEDRKALESEVAKFNYLIKVEDPTIKSEILSDNTLNQEEKDKQTYEMLANAEPLPGEKYEIIPTDDVAHTGKEATTGFRGFLNSIKRFIKRLQTKTLPSGERALSDEEIQKSQDFQDKIDNVMKNQNIEKVAVPEDIRALRSAYRDALMMSKDATKSFNEYNQKHGLSKQVEKGLNIVKSKSFKTMMDSEGKINAATFIDPIRNAEEKSYKYNDNIANVYGRAAENIINSQGNSREFRENLKNGYTNSENFDYVETLFKKDAERELNKAKKQVRRENEENER